MNMRTKLAVPGAIALSIGFGAVGGSLLNTASVSAATTTATTSTAPALQPDPAKGGHVGSNGVTEQLLTGDAATKAKTAAEAAVSGGTVERVENDAEGATYEAHVTKTDGSRVTVKMDANFKVTGTETGMGQSQGK